jgi:hypothetical protein
MFKNGVYKWEEFMTIVSKENWIKVLSLLKLKGLKWEGETDIIKFNPFTDIKYPESNKMTEILLFFEWNSANRKPMLIFDDNTPENLKFEKVRKTLFLTKILTNDKFITNVNSFVEPEKMIF